VKFWDTITNGKPERMSEAIREYMAHFEGKRVIIEIKEETDGASDKQRKYLFGVIIKQIREEYRRRGQTYDPDDLYEDIKVYIWQHTTNRIDIKGRMREKTLSWNDIKDPAQFEEFAEMTRAWAAETLEIEISLPNEGLIDDNAGT